MSAKLSYFSSPSALDPREHSKGKYYNGRSSEGKEPWGLRLCPVNTNLSRMDLVCYGFGIRETATTEKVEKVSISAKFSPWHVTSLKYEVTNKRTHGEYGFLPDCASPQSILFFYRRPLVLVFLSNGRMSLFLSFFSSVRLISPQET